MVPGDIRDMSACKLGIPSLLTCYGVSGDRKWRRKAVQDSKPLPLCRWILERSHTDGCGSLERKEALETDDGFEINEHNEHNSREKECLDDIPVRTPQAGCHSSS